MSNCAFHIFVHKTLSLLIECKYRSLNDWWILIILQSQNGSYIQTMNKMLIKINGLNLYVKDNCSF